MLDSMDRTAQGLQAARGAAAAPKAADPKPSSRHCCSACAAFSILTTVGIIYELGKEALLFVRMPEVDLLTTITSTRWQPHTGEFGIWGLVTATFMTSLIAMLVAAPLGLAVAIYLSEYASPRARAHPQTDPGSPGGCANDRLWLLCPQLHDAAAALDLRPGRRADLQHRLGWLGDGHTHPAPHRLHDRGRPDSRAAFACGRPATEWAAHGWR